MSPMNRTIAVCFEISIDLRLWSSIAIVRSLRLWTAHLVFFCSVDNPWILMKQLVWFRGKILYRRLLVFLNGRCGNFSSNTTCHSTYKFEITLMYVCNALLSRNINIIDVWFLKWRQIVRKDYLKIIYQNCKLFEIICLGLLFTKVYKCNRQFKLRTSLMTFINKITIWCLHPIRKKKIATTLLNRK